MRVVQHEGVLSGMKYIHEEISANLARDNADFAPCAPFVTGGMIFIGQTSQHYIAVRGADIVPHAKGTGGEIDRLFNGDSNKVEAVPYDYEPQF